MTLKHQKPAMPSWRIILRGGMRRNAPVLHTLHECSEIFAATVARTLANTTTFGTLLMQTGESEHLHSKYYPNDIRHNLSTFHFEHYDSTLAKWVQIDNPKRQRV